jgi:hypothetical protein
MALLLSAFLTVVLVGMSGQFGVFVKGLRVPVDAAGRDQALVHWVTGAAVSAGLLLAPYDWRPRSRYAITVCGCVLGVLAVLALYVRPDVSVLALVGLPAVVGLLALTALSVRDRAEEPLRADRPAHLWTTVLFATVYAVGMTIALAVLA